MSKSVAASDIQKDFDLWHDRALQEPVQVTRNGRETVYLVSAETFNQLWASYRRVGSTTDLTDAEVALIDEAKIPAEYDYDYEDDPVVDLSPTTER